MRGRGSRHKCLDIFDSQLDLTCPFHPILGSDKGPSRSNWYQGDGCVAGDGWVLLFGVEVEKLASRDYMIAEQTKRFR